MKIKFVCILFVAVAVCLGTEFDAALERVQAKANKQGTNDLEITEYSLSTEGDTKVSNNFKVREFACADRSDKIIISKKLVRMLQRVRDFYGAGVTIVTGYHSDSYAATSESDHDEYHRQGVAADFKVSGYEPAAIADFLEFICTTCGIGVYDNFVHLDIRGTKKLWKETEQSEVKTFWTGVEVTAEQLNAMFPKIKDNAAAEYAVYLNEAFHLGSVNTKLRMAHFLGQIGHESGGLTMFSEWFSGKDPETYFNTKYGHRTDIGNTVETDGYKYRGRGPIQITGKANYELCGKALDIDLISQPDLLLEPKYGFRAAGWFWAKRRINADADADDAVAVTKKVNGGTNGLQDREQRTTLAKQIINI